MRAKLAYDRQSNHLSNSYEAAMHYLKYCTLLDVILHLGWRGQFKTTLSAPRVLIFINVMSLILGGIY